MLFKLFFLFQTLFIFPLVNLLALIVPLVRKRKNFEVKNFEIQGEPNWQADIAFEVSSEGEFEQILSLCEIYLSQKRKIEIIFCSESAVEVVTKWASDKSAAVRVLRLPLVTNIPFVQKRSVLTFLTAKVLVLCRYDFFPELLYYGMFKAEKFVLLDATLIHKFEKVKKGFSLTKYIYKKFNLIITSTQNDILRISSAFEIDKTQLACFNFRSLRIIDRVVKAPTKFEKFPSFKCFDQFIQSFNYNQRLLLGNFYNSEVGLISDSFAEKILNREVLALVVPHKIEDEITFATLKKYSINFTMSELEMAKIIADYKQAPGIFVLKQKGVLCELFQFFSVAYVGGGFHSSIHSILEPHLSGAFVVCGPNIGRSTEFELAKNRDEASVVSIRNQTDFFPIASDYLKRVKVSKDLAESFSRQRDEALSLSAQIINH